MSETFSPENNPANPNADLPVSVVHTDSATGTANIVGAIQNPSPLVSVKEMKFGFRTVKDKDSGTESKRPNVEVKIPVLSFDGLVHTLQNGGKELELLYSVVEETYSNYIKELLSEDESITTENFPFDKISWTVMANVPETERKGRGIAKEVWEDFIKDYLEVMPGATGKPIENIKAQAAILAAKLNPLRSAEKAKKERVITGIQNVLAVYLSTSPKAEQFVECVTYLDKKCTTILTTDKEADLEANLGFA